MRRILPTLALVLMTALSLVAAIFMAVDGNLARLTGWYHFEVGMPLFSEENRNRLDDVCWMRIETLNDRMECSRDENGVWWITTPVRDRMSPVAVQAILAFTAKARMVDTLPLNNTTRASMREYGVTTSPHTITLKVPDGDGHTTIARYTLGSASPWLVDAGDGKSLLPTTYLRTDFYGRDKRIHVVSGNILSIFKSGLTALRDPHPLLFHPDSVRDISITGPGADERGELRLSRLSAESAWNILSPGLASADQDGVAVLLNKLSGLTAQRVDDKEDIPLPDMPHISVKLRGDWGDRPLEINFYEPFTPEAGEQKLCYATVADRPVVFTLPVEPRVLRKGSYSRIVGAVCSFPVLPEKALAQLKSETSVPYVGDLPVRMEKLRSLRFADLDPKDIDRVSLRSRFSSYPLRLMMIPGDSESQVEDTWMYSAEGQRYAEAENMVVRNFLRGLSGIPVVRFLEDVPPGGDMREVMRRYGLHAPDYVLSLLPHPSRPRATIFGQDLPIVRDRAPRSFYIKRYHDPESGEAMWVGMELGSNTICQLSTKLTRSFSLRSETWKKRNLFDFPISALRKLTLGFQQAPLELEYDYIGESWTGTLKGEDVTPRINPHRAEHYVRQLQKLSAMQWLENEDSDALEALRAPAFTVKLDLEITDYSDIEAITIDQAEDINTGALAGNRDMAEDLLGGSSETDEQMRDMAMAERKTHKKTLTLEIAPSDYEGEQPFFYGRIVETGELFMLSYRDAQGLAGSILDF